MQGPLVQVPVHTLYVLQEVGERLDEVDFPLSEGEGLDNAADCDPEIKKLSLLLSKDVCKSS